MTDRRRRPGGAWGATAAALLLVAGCVMQAAPEPPAEPEAAAALPGGKALTPAECAPDPAAAAADPLARPGLAAIACPVPGREGDALLVVTDPNVSWPEVVAGGARTSFEDTVLAAPVAPGLPYFDPAADSVEWIWAGSAAAPQGAVVSFRSQNPQTGAPERVFLAVVLEPPELIGAVRDRAIAADLIAGPAAAG